MRDICIFAPQFSKAEKQEISILKKAVWDEMENNFEPLMLEDISEGELNFIPTYIRKSIKVELNKDGVEVYDTSTEPYSPINNKYILRLILDNISKEEDEEKTEDIR